MEQSTNQINYLHNDYQKIVIISENLNSSEMLVKKNDNPHLLSFDNNLGMLSSSASLLNSEKHISHLAINENTNIQAGLKSDIQIRAP